VLLLVFAGLAVQITSGKSLWGASSAISGTAEPTSEPGATPYPNTGKLVVNTKTEYYVVTGTTVSELQNSLYASSLHMPGGDAWAYTQSSFEFDYTTSQSLRECRITTITVTLNLTYKYPQWQIAGSPTLDATYAWEPFIYALTRHEEYHGTIAKETGRKFLSALRALPPEGNCDALLRNMQSEIDRVDAIGRQRQAEWDEHEGPLPFPIR
jgi:predicted secreted Zn-dependent protease